jgi:hypothetical protein
MWMIRKAMLLTLSALALSCLVERPSVGQQPPSAGGQPPASGNYHVGRFYHYPYVYYPQNYWGNEYYQSSDSLYHRYPPEMQIPVYNRKWHNYYPSSRRYHWGHHFILDVF